MRILRRVISAVLAALIAWAFSTVSATGFGDPDIIGVFSDVILYNRLKSLQDFDSKFNEGTEQDWTVEYVKSGLQLQQELADREMDRYLKAQLSKINNTTDKTELDLNSDYVNLIGDMEADGANRGLFVAIGLGKGEVVKVGDDYYYLFPFETSGNPKAKEFVQKELSKAVDAWVDKDFVAVLKKYGIKHMKIEQKVSNVELQLGPKYGTKQNFKTTMFASAYFNVADAAIASKLKQKYKLYYFGYVRYDEMVSLFGEDFYVKVRWNDLFISFLDGMYSLGIITQWKNVYETNVVKQNYFYVIEYAYNVYMRYVMYLTFLWGILFGYLKAVSFRNRQKTLLSMSPDRI